MATTKFIGGEYVATALSAAELVVDGMVHHVQRHYDQRQEGLRTCREREYAKIRKTGYRNLLKRKDKLYQNEKTSAPWQLRVRTSKMVRTLQPPVEEVTASEVFERIQPLTLNCRDPKGILTIPANYASKDTMDGDVTRVVNRIKSVREDFTTMRLNVPVASSGGETVHSKAEDRQSLLGSMSNITDCQE
ncbi:hypothetical protein FHETE_9587 [Fusarium heterosporum]|uniref:Uncharacterized protein n=1 Tax=Fusarium heterosporum TaxID=42747 RepID=A0A8H5SYH2_FUSHE|nr:hypothetical protein FHETE_9587 [Fusarium heterosporum]